MISLHTSPLAQPGTGDAGGMNVYVAQTARGLAARGVEVEIFTRCTSAEQPPIVPVEPGVTVRNVVAGPFEGMDKNELPGQLCAFTVGLLRAEAAHERGHYDLVHSHYWLSGQVGFLVKERWGVPLVHSAHTLAKVKNAALTAGDEPEPRGRIIGEEQVLAEADLLVAHTKAEARELRDHYGVAPQRIEVVHPGVDLATFRPGPRSDARAELGWRDDDQVILFAGRLQQLKAPDVLVQALPALGRSPGGRRIRLVLAGGNSGSGRKYREELYTMATALGVADRIVQLPPLPPPLLATAFRAADVVAMPSRSESFGLVALEAQACGTPVVAAAVGGLPVAVRDGRTGRLVHGHEPAAWAQTLGELLADPAQRARLGEAAADHAAHFSWDRTVDGLLAGYGRALAARLAPVS